MKLIGHYLSPFSRRVDAIDEMAGPEAISLHAMNMPFEDEQISAFKDVLPDAVREHNPVIRIPALVLDDGEVLIESYAILDAIDEMAGPEAWPCSLLRPNAHTPVLLSQPGLVLEPDLDPLGLGQTG